MTGPVLDDASRVVAELLRVADGLPALKLDLSEDQATLTVVIPDGSVRSYRWRDQTISRVESDVQFLGQSSFDPGDFPLDQARRMLDMAALAAGSSSSQILQIVDYGNGRVYMSVSTRPESRTVFFNDDGSMIAKLGYLSVADIEAGVEAVTGRTPRILAFGFSQQHGYWADVPRPAGVIERRTRTGTLPTFVSLRNQASSLASFDPLLLDPIAISHTIALLTGDSGQGCSVEVDNRFGRVQPVVRYDCLGKVSYTDLQGRDMTAQVG